MKVLLTFSGALQDWHFADGCLLSWVPFPIGWLIVSPPHVRSPTTRIAAVRDLTCPL